MGSGSGPFCGHTRAGNLAGYRPIAAMLLVNTTFCTPAAIAAFIMARAPSTFTLNCRSGSFVQIAKTAVRRAILRAAGMTTV